MARARSAGRAQGAAEDALRQLYAAPGHLIRRCQQIAVAIFMEETREFDLTPVQYAALVVVRAQPGVDQTRLVNLIALDRSTIGNVVTRLEAKKLILYPTALGGATLDAIAGAVAAAQRRILTPLAPTERRQFMSMLTRLVDINNIHSRAPLRPPKGAAAEPMPGE